MNKELNMNNEKENFLLTLSESADLLKCSRSMLYRLIEQGYQMPAIRVGALIRFRRSDLIEYFETKFQQERQKRLNSIEAKAAELTEKLK